MALICGCLTPQAALEEKAPEALKFAQDKARAGLVSPVVHRQTENSVLCNQSASVRSLGCLSQEDAKKKAAESGLASVFKSAETAGAFSFNFPG